jgi:hypothetical protein
LAESTFVKVAPSSTDMKPSPAYWEKSQPAIRLACARAGLAANAARASAPSQVTTLVFMLPSFS